VSRIVFCSGKVAWDAIDERDRRGAPVAIVRIEQLYPLPTEQMLGDPREVPECPRAALVAGGAREHGRLELHRANTWRVKEQGYDLRHVARVESGSPATGSKAIHDQELADLMERTFRNL
jgi:2-oxoglutarate decarboxylase